MRTYYIWVDRGRLNISDAKPHEESVIVYQGNKTVEWLKDNINNYERVQALLKSLVDDEVISRWENEGGLYK